MKLWLITQNEETGYDSYDSAVVAAEDSLSARRTHPSDFYAYSEDFHGWALLMHDGSLRQQTYYSRTWASKPQNVYAKYIGEAQENIAAGVICSSFNAG